MIRSHCKAGCSEDRIASLLPVGHTTVSRWISVFASQGVEIPRKGSHEEMVKEREKAQKSAEEESLELKQSYAKLEKGLCGEHMFVDLSMLRSRVSTLNVVFEKSEGSVGHRRRLPLRLGDVHTRLLGSHAYAAHLVLCMAEVLLHRHVV